MAARKDVEPSRATDRFALAAGSITSLAAVWYAGDLLRAVPMRAESLPAAGALFLLGLSLVAGGLGHRLRRPLRWAAAGVMAAALIWSRW